jgi:lysyl-tRNA synthetase class 2
MKQKNWQRMRENPALLEQLLVREQVIDAIRIFFKQKEFNEVETPLLVKSPGTEPQLEVFETKLKHLSGRDEAAYLLTSPEYAMKKLLVAGFEKIFQICKSFRNQESLGGNHNPEFTILEWYRTKADYRDIMSDFEDLMLFILKYLKEKYSNPQTSFQKQMNERLGKDKLEYQGRVFNLSTPYLRLSVIEAFEKYLGLNREQLLDKKELIRVAKKLNFQVAEDSEWEEIFYQLFLNKIEPEVAKLNQPVIIYDYPWQQAALSRRKKEDNLFAERFEVYLGGLELGNAFSELTDPVEQEERLKEELELREKLGKTKYQLDSDFINALKVGMPSAGGIAVGVDRLIMLFAGVDEINDTLLFPGSEIFT